MKENDLIQPPQHVFKGIFTSELSDKQIYKATLQEGHNYSLKAFIFHKNGSSDFYLCRFACLCVQTLVVSVIGVFV